MTDMNKEKSLMLHLEDHRRLKMLAVEADLTMKAVVHHTLNIIEKKVEAGVKSGLIPKDAKSPKWVQFSLILLLESGQITKAEFDRDIKNLNRELFAKSAEGSGVWE